MSLALAIRKWAALCARSLVREDKHCGAMPHHYRSSVDESGRYEMHIKSGALQRRAHLINNAGTANNMYQKVLFIKSSASRTAMRGELAACTHHLQLGYHIVVLTTTVTT